VRPGLSYGEVFVVHGPTAGDLVVVWILVGVTIVTVLLQDRRFELERASLRAARIAACMFSVSAVAAALVFLRDFDAARAQYRRGAYSVVEGTVSDVVFGSTMGHRDESFRVGDQVFRYSSATVSPYFHRTAERGGPIRPGLRVRISHVNGDILRLEVAR
jgi:hypothetical protein